ncbi:MAG: transposase [Methanobacteriaceae archaeon]|nr:transposase [Methanobacteriaceae archaeon]
MIIIINNYSVHKTYLSKIICKLLNIQPIYLPKYSHHLNPIEQLWRTIKNSIYPNPIINIESLTNDFYRIIRK